jgi:hypothetical protein
MLCIGGAAAIAGEQQLPAVAGAGSVADRRYREC